MQRRRGRRDGVEDGGGDGGAEVTATVAQTTPGMSAGFFPSLAAHPLDRLGFCRWVLGSMANFGVCAPCGPHLSFIAQCDGGPPTIVGWAPPIRARGGRPSRTLPLGGVRPEIKPNILPLDLYYFFQLYTLSLTLLTLLVPS